MFSVNRKLPPFPVIEPPEAIVTSTAAIPEVPTVHGVPDDIVIGWVTVQVSPGVEKVVGDVDPFVQFASVVMFPAVPVVQGVARTLYQEQLSNKLKSSTVPVLTIWVVSFFIFNNLSGCNLDIAIKVTLFYV